MFFDEGELSAMKEAHQATLDKIAPKKNRYETLFAKFGKSISCMAKKAIGMSDINCPVTHSMMDKAFEENQIIDDNLEIINRYSDLAVTNEKATGYHKDMIINVRADFQAKIDHSQQVIDQIKTEKKLPEPKPEIDISEYIDIKLGGFLKIKK